MRATTTAAAETVRVQPRAHSPGGDLPPGRPPGPAYVPPVDVWRHADTYTLRLDIPGARARDTRVHLDRGRLHVHARIDVRAPLVTDPATAPLRIEFGIADYRRAFALPDDAATDGAAATLRDGVLNVRIPRRPAAALGGTPVPVTPEAPTKPPSPPPGASPHQSPAARAGSAPSPPQP